MATILFVGHESSRSGAPFTQLHLMRWIKKNTSHKMVLVLLKGGDLVPEFEELADVYLVNNPKFAFHYRVWSKLNRMSGREHNNTINKLITYAPDVIFASSLLAINYGVKLKEIIGVKLICNIHELDSPFFHAPKEPYADSMQKSDWLMMGSNAVKKFYLTNFPIDPDKVSVIYDFTADEKPEPSALTDIKKMYNIPQTAKIVGGMGSLQWRKGPELFLYVARELLNQSPDTYFFWVGGSKESPEYKFLARESELLGLENRVVLPGEQADIHSYYNAFDVFLLTSREDPFPLVCLESALAETPIICFKESGGMPEFVRDDAGFVVDYLSIDQMAQKALLLLNDDALREQMGAVARDRALNHHTISKLGPSILKLIEAALQ